MPIFNQLFCSKVLKVKSNNLQIYIERLRYIFRRYINIFLLCKKEKDFDFSFTKENIMERFFIGLYFILQYCILGFQILVLRFKIRKLLLENRKLVLEQRNMIAEYSSRTMFVNKSFEGLK